MCPLQYLKVSGVQHEMLVGWGAINYAVLDLRVSKGFGDYAVHVDGTNLFDASYQEVLGVQMPGAAVSVSLSARLR